MKILVFLLFFFSIIKNGFAENNNIYDKIDIFGEVLDKINK